MILFSFLFNFFLSPNCSDSWVLDHPMVEQTIPNKKPANKKKIAKPIPKKVSKFSQGIKEKNVESVEELQLPPEENIVTNKISTVVGIPETVIGELETNEPPVDPVIVNKAKVIPESEFKSGSEIFTATEQPAEFPGGAGAWGRYIAKTLKYPKTAQKANIGGRVYVSFVVNTDGSIQDVQVLKGVGFGCDEEAVRVIKAMPRWIPGKQSGSFVRSRFTQPITFILTEDEDDKKSTPTYSTYTPPVYNPEINSNKWKESLLIEHFAKGLKNEQEGIYEEISNKSHKYKLAFLEEDGDVKLIFLKNSGVWNGNLNEFSTFKEGDLKSGLTRTSNQNIYKANWKMADRSINDDVYVIFREFFMDVIFPDGEKNTYLKIYPSYNLKPISPKESSSSGTGFAISSNGIIATNHHVITGASTIKVRGINGDFSKAYFAKLLMEDKNNDLALLQIQDSNFYTLGVIPYIIGSKSSEVGTSIFVLGYPLRSSMGDEIKVTDGIISSKSGYENDITTYQISAPVQPGNSGGPLFDKKGNIIGVVNAKHMGAENATYAIKASYLLSLIDQLPIIPSLQTKNLIYSKPLTEQIKLIKRFTYIIESN